MEAKRRGYRTLTGVFLLLVMGVMLINRTRVFTDAVYLSMLPATICGFALLFSPSDQFQKGKVRIHPWRAAVCAALTLLWLAMLSLFEIRRGGLFSRRFLNEVYADVPRLARFFYGFHRFVFFPTICAGAWALFYGGLSRCVAGNDRPVAMLEDNAARKRLVRRCWACVVVATVFGVMCVYPMYTVSDTLLLKQYIDNGEWNAWHTMGYLVFAYLTSLGGKSYFLVLIAQGSCWAYANHTALRFLSKRGNGARACVVYTAVSIMSILPYLYCGVMYKDGLFTSCMLGLCVALTEALTDEDANVFVYARLALFGLGAALFRLGTLPAVLAAFVALLVLAWKKRRALLVRTGIAAGALLSAYLIVNHALPHLLSATPAPGYVMYTLPVNMIGAVAASGAEMETDELAVMEKLMPYEEWAAAYEPYFMDPLSRTDGVIGTRVGRIDELRLGPELLKLNARFLLRYPRVYLTAFFNANSIVWEMGRPDDARAAEWNWLLNFARKPMDSEAAGVLTQTTGFTPLMVSAVDFSYDNAVYRCLVWRGGTGLFVLILCAVAFAAQRRLRLCIALLTPFVYSIMLMLSIPSQDPRYILPAVVTAVFFGVYAVVSPAVSCADEDRNRN